MTHTLVFPHPHFQNALRMLTTEPDHLVFCPVGVSHLTKETRYLIRCVERMPTSLSDHDRENAITVATAADAQIQPCSPPIPGTLGHLIIGAETRSGQWWGGVVPAGGTTNPLSRISLPGAGMYALESSASTCRSVSENSPMPLRRAYQRFSRTIGALGRRQWQRLTALHIAVIGCGRTGSVAATTLARLGVRSLTLIDPDALEQHNVTEMDAVNDRDVGRLKVEAVADFLQAHCAPAHAPLRLATIPQLITSAYRSAIEADVLFCCVDNDAARLACGILATLFHKVLIDIGTGILNELTSPESLSVNRETETLVRSRGNRTMGADVRLILPVNGCLRCFGSVADYDEAIRNLIGRKNPIACNHFDPNNRRQEQWWLRRSGSLHTLNLLAVSVGVHLLCDLVAERVQRSRWSQLEYDDTGRLTVQHIDPTDSQIRQQCPLCLKAGQGETGLYW